MAAILPPSLLGLACCAVLAAAAAAPALADATAAAPVATPAAAPALSGATGPDVEVRWRDSFNRFAFDDAADPPPAGGVVFVGSSSIRLWQGLENQFGEGVSGRVINRGFGGSRIADCVRYVDRLVLQYRPRTVVVYAGDNDLAEGRTPQQVLDAFVALAGAVEHALPQTRLAFISIKPSPLRRLLLPSVQQANLLVQDYVREHDSGGGPARLAYIDVYRAMVDAAGAPREDLYQPDQLHLNARGYALWREALAPYLAQPQLPLQPLQRLR